MYNVYAYFSRKNGGKKARTYMVKYGSSHEVILV